MTPLTKRQMSILSRLRSYSGNCNWAGTPQSARKALCAKGLIVDTSRVPGKHLQWSTYRITEFGLDVLCGIEFDKALAFGYVKYCENLDWHAERARKEAEAERIEEEVTHGLRYRPNQHIEDDVRAVLWKNVVLLP